MPKEQRRDLFDKCVKSMTATTTAGWFTPVTGERVRRDNAVDWLLWGLFSTKATEMLKDWEDELEYYVTRMGEFIGYPLAQGSNPDLQCLRLTFDPVVMAHRPFLWYCVRTSPSSCSQASPYSCSFRSYVLSIR